jgi:hypothetical protein
MNFFTKTHLQVSTYSAYNNKLNKWFSLMSENKNTLVYIFTHPNLSLCILRKYLTTYDTDTAPTISSYIKAVISAAEHNTHLFNNIDTEIYNKCETRWKELRQIFYDYANSYRFEQKPSPTQALKNGSLLKFSDLTKKRDELVDGSIDKLILSFYTYIPPLRADLFSTQLLKFGEVPAYDNHIFYDSNKAFMVIKDFKTSKLYKSIEYELPSELHKQLITSLRLCPRKFLFQNKNGIPFNRKSFSVWASNKLSTLFKKQLTLTLFRHIYVSTLDSNMPATKLLEISGKMGHSLTQQILYKWRDNDSETISALE